MQHNGSVMQKNHELREHIEEDQSKIEYLESLLAEGKDQMVKKERVYFEVLNEMQVSQVYNSVLEKKVEELQDETVSFPKMNRKPKLEPKVLSR